jgi:hypothetical protein
MQAAVAYCHNAPSKYKAVHFSWSLTVHQLISFVAQLTDSFSLKHSSLAVF